MSRRKSPLERERTFVALDLDCGGCGAWLDRAWIHTDEPPTQVVHFREDRLLHGRALSRIKGRAPTGVGEALRYNVHQGPDPMVRVYACNKCSARPQRSISDIRAALVAVWEPGRQGSWRVALR
jgi:hypothetical protein